MPDAGRLEQNRASPLETTIRFIGLKASRSAAAKRAQGPSPVRTSRASRPRDGASGRGGPKPRRLVTTASRPSSDTPSQVPPPSRSRPASTSGASSQRASGADGRACASSRLPARTSGQSGCDLQAKANTHILVLRARELAQSSRPGAGGQLGGTFRHFGQARAPGPEAAAGRQRGRGAAVRAGATPGTRLAWGAGSPP